MEHNDDSTVYLDDHRKHRKTSSNKKRKHNTDHSLNHTDNSLELVHQKFVQNSDTNSDSQENVTIDHEHGIQIVIESKALSNNSFSLFKSAFHAIKTIKIETRLNNKRKADSYVNSTSQSNSYVNNNRISTNSNCTEDDSPISIKKTTCNPLHLLTVGMRSFHEYLLRKSKSNEDDSLEVDVDSVDESIANVEREFSNNWHSMVVKMNENQFPIMHHRFRLEKLIGEGTFSHIVACSDVFFDQLDDVPGDPRKKVAIKLMKPKFNAIGQSEARILEYLSQKDGYLESNTIQFLSWFNYKDHFCLVLERLDLNLWALTQRNQVKFTLDNIRDIAFQLLNCLAFLQLHGIIHGDLKPENILLQHPVLASKGYLQVLPKIKLADFGNAMNQEQTQYYLDTFEVQSMCYRAPEIVLGMSIGHSIDMWSLGCVLVELLLGLQTPLFQGDNNSQLLYIMHETLGPIPKNLFKPAKFYTKFFSKDGDLRIKYEARTGNVFETIRERTRNPIFIDFIMRVLEYDPSKRLTPSVAMTHPFFKPLLPRGTPTLELTVGKTLYGNLAQQYGFKLVEKTELKPSWLYQKKPSLLVEEESQDEDLEVV